MIAKPKIIMLNLIWLPVAYTGLVVYCPGAEELPCLQGNDKPKPDNNSNLEIALYYEGSMSGTNQAVRGYVCQLISDCGNQIKIRLVPGASTAKFGNDIMCYTNADCKPDQAEICQGFIHKSYLNTCEDPNAPKQKMNDCLQQKKDDINNQLLNNSAERADKGIPICYLPVLTFQGLYDGPLCAKYSTYQELKDYVCKEVYDNKLGCCSSN